MCLHNPTTAIRAPPQLTGRTSLYVKEKAAPGGPTASPLPWGHIQVRLRLPPSPLW